MVLNGSPDFPGESDETLRTNESHIINYGPNTSDDSDADDGMSHEGYEPLPLADSGEDAEIDNCAGIQSTDTNLPNIISSDVELAREVWSQPRPLELEIHLDNTRAEQIMSAMANITLPTSAIPDWAQGVPEELWKQNLLERIRQRKESDNKGNIH